MATWRLVSFPKDHTAEMHREKGQGGREKGGKFVFESCASLRPWGGGSLISILQTRVLRGRQVPTPSAVTHSQEGQEARSACAPWPVLLASPGLSLSESELAPG